MDEGPGPIPKGKVGRAIVGFLRGHFPRTFQPKTIAREIREKPATVRKEINRLEERGHVVNVDNTGWYRAWADPGLLSLAEKPEPCVHAIQIVAPVPLGGGSGVPRGARQARLGGHEADGWSLQENEDQAIRRIPVAGRMVEFRASGTGRLLISVSATSFPVRFDEWKEFAAELRGTCRGLGVDLDSPMAQLTGIEFNADWRQYFLAGLKRMKLSEVTRAWGQIYQKHRDALRLEVRVAPVELSFREAAAALVEMVEYRPRGMQRGIVQPVAEPVMPAPPGPEVA